MKRLEQLAYV